VTTRGSTLIGVPFDGGATLGWPGSRQAPAKIRAHLQWMRMREEAGTIWSADLDRIVDVPADLLRDGGDIDVVGHDLLETTARTSTAVTDVVAAGRVPIVLGGDDSLLFPAVRGLHEATTGTVGLIHFDAHLDLLDENEHQGRYSHSSGVRRCLDLDRFRADATAQVAVRNYNFPSSRRVIEKAGITEVTAADVHRDGLDASLDRVLAAVEPVDHVFLSFDIDAIDPAHAPGAGAHEPGGLTSRQALDAVTRLAPHVDGFAVTEVNPMTDHQEMTSILAAYLVYTFALHAARS
jgi:formiminoglutamase/agmatinase